MPVGLDVEAVSVVIRRRGSATTTEQGTPMNSTTVISIRTYLVTASIAATAIDAIVLVAIELFGIRESAFETLDFRLAVVTLIAIALASTRLLAFAAYRRALAQRRTSVRTNGVVHPQDGCRLRLLVLLHLRFSGMNAERYAQDGLLI
ncbi:hypothetical protein PPGU19_058050 [Paraburkholderia sp. PGU19]|nr:hypothetical protein PPGU19_058050 [Paraburkholderia sp. PGU19]